MNMLRNLRKMYATGGLLGPDNVDPPKKKSYNLSSILYGADKPIDVGNKVTSTPKINLGMNGAPEPTKKDTSTLSGIEKVADMAKSVVPFISNIMNSKRKVPAPPAPELNNYTTLNKVDFSDERNQVQRSERVSNMNSDRSLDENSATAAKLFSRGQTMEKLSEVNNREKNTNIGISNQEAQMRSRTDEVNNAKLDDFAAAKVQRKITQQNADSENLSNAADKYVLGDTERRKAKLEDDRTKTYSTMFSQSGVMLRNAIARKNANGAEAYKGEFSDPLLLAEEARMKEAGNKKMFGGRLKKAY